jgi:hypothetical protein
VFCDSSDISRFSSAARPASLGWRSKVVNLHLEERREGLKALVGGPRVTPEADHVLSLSPPAKALRVLVRQPAVGLLRGCGRVEGPAHDAELISFPVNGIVRRLDVLAEPFRQGFVNEDEGAGVGRNATVLCAPDGELRGLRNGAPGRQSAFRDRKAGQQGEAVVQRLCGHFSRATGRDQCREGCDDEHAGFHVVSPSLPETDKVATAVAAPG